MTPIFTLVSLTVDSSRLTERTRRRQRPVDCELLTVLIVKYLA